MKTPLLIDSMIEIFEPSLLCIRKRTKKPRIKALEKVLIYNFSPVKILFTIIFFSGVQVNCIAQYQLYGSFSNYYDCLFNPFENQTSCYSSNYFNISDISENGILSAEFELEGYAWIDLYYYSYDTSGYSVGWITGLNGSINDLYNGDYFYNSAQYFENGTYLFEYDFFTKNYTFTRAQDCSEIVGGISTTISEFFPNGSTAACDDANLEFHSEPFSVGWSYQWFENDQIIPEAIGNELNVTRSVNPIQYNVVLTCATDGNSFVSSDFILPPCYNNFSSGLNYILLQNVTTTGNIPGQSIQVQFDITWGNTWKDDINWDAAWVFMKYKNAQGQWKHAKLSPFGHDNGQGTPNIIEPSGDNLGAIIRLAIEGQGNFNAEGIQLRWNYGIDGLSSVSGIEVRVFAMEMVYMPEGDYVISNVAPGGQQAVVNRRLTPNISLNVEGDSDNFIRIKGDAGIDINSDGLIDNYTYPTGFYPFYVFKNALSAQQYSDFLNCLTAAQKTGLGVASNPGSTIFLSGGQYYASSPNNTASMSGDLLRSYCDWSGLRPVSILEEQKVNGPNGNDYNYGNFYGGDLFGYGIYNLYPLSSLNRDTHGNGDLPANGITDLNFWSSGYVNNFLVRSWD